MNKPKPTTAKPRRGNRHPGASPQLPATVSAEQLSALVNLTVRRLKQLVDAAKLPRPKAGRWELVPSVRGLLAYYKSQTASDEIRTAKLAKLRAETELLEQTFAEREGTLISFDDAVDVGQRGNAAMVAGIMAWTQHPIELREEIILKIREAGMFFHSQLVAERKKYENETPENPQASA